MKLTTELFGANPNIPAWVADLIDFVEPESALERKLDADPTPAPIAQDNVASQVAPSLPESRQMQQPQLVSPASQMEQELEAPKQGLALADGAEPTPSIENGTASSLDPEQA